MKSVTCSILLNCELIKNASQPCWPDWCKEHYDRITKILFLISTVWHVATPFLVFSSFLDLTISGHVTQNSDVLRNKKIKLTDFAEAAKSWKGLVNFHKVMIIIRFYANYSFRRHAYAHKEFFAFSYFLRTIADWSASEAMLSSASLETFKSNFSAFLN